VNRYLDGLRWKQAFGVGSLALVLWIALIVMFLTVWLVLSPTETSFDAAVTSPVVRLAPIVTVVVLLVAVVVAVRLAAKGRLEKLFAAEERLLEDDVESAVGLARQAVAATQQLPRHQALMLLGQCAERNGDFREAAEVYARAVSVLPSTPGLATLRDQLAPVAAARQAFALAAADRLDEAEHMIARARGPIAMPTARALAARARVLVAAKRGAHRYREVLEVLAAERLVLRNTLGARDRALLRSLAAFAKRGLEGSTTRAAATDVLAVDAEHRKWIARVMPALGPMLGGGP
jgi:tetratricopeptide (TPR) repeat protein